MLLSDIESTINHTLSEQTLNQQRPVLFRYALLQLRDNDLADDIVQETLLAAWQSSASFDEKSGLRTWLIGILKHKLVDHWRRNAREIVVTGADRIDTTDNETDEDDFFMSNGHWNGGPTTWGDPETALQQQEFWLIYETCQNKLPAQMAKVFMLRELVGLEAGEVCEETGLSESNYWVTMHRARLRLRECLEIHWFNTTKQEQRHA